MGVNYLYNDTFLKDGYFRGVTGDVKEFYKFMRNSILYNNIPLIKPIGFYISSGMLDSQKVLQRQASCLENMIELSANLSSIIFYSEEDCQMCRSLDITGELTTENAEFRGGSKPMLVVSPPQFILNTNMDSKILLNLVVKKSTGSMTTEESSLELRKITAGISNYRSGNRYVPMRTTFSMINYVRIKPLEGDNIEVALDGITEDNFNLIWRDYIKHLK